MWFELTTLVVIATDCIDSYESNYHMITTTRPLDIEYGISVNGGINQDKLHVVCLYLN